MDERPTYDEDIFAWSQEQAAALRALGSRRDLPNELDLALVAEEIEDVGKSELNAAKSFARLLLAQLVKLASVPDSPAAAVWRKEVLLFQVDFRDRLSSAMQQRFSADEVWQRALMQADADLTRHGDQVAPSLP